MLHLLLGLVLLFLLSGLLWWWARGGVIPAIMMSAPPVAFLPVLAVSIHDRPGAENLFYAPLVLLGLLALAWAPRILMAIRREQGERPQPPSGSAWARRMGGVRLNCIPPSVWTGAFDAWHALGCDVYAPPAPRPNAALPVRSSWRMICLVFAANIGLLACLVHWQR